MYTAEQRAEIMKNAQGKVVQSLEYESAEDNPETGSYWVMTFNDGSEISFRTMAELSRPAPLVIRRSDPAMPFTVEFDDGRQVQCEGRVDGDDIVVKVPEGGRVAKIRYGRPAGGVNVSLRTVKLEEP